MEPANNKAMDDLLEALRKKGGAELAGHIQRVTQLERDMIKKIEAIHIGMLDQCEAEGIPEIAACAAMCQAYSHCYAIAVASLGLVTPDSTRAELTATAISSLMTNLVQKFDTVEAQKNGVLDKIKACGGGNV